MPKKHWKPIYLVEIYRMVRMGMREEDIVKELGITRKTLFVWQEERVELKEAVRMARKEREDSKFLPEWIFQHLRPELRDLWKRIWDLHSPREVGVGDEDPVEVIERMLLDEGRGVRQELFLHALCVTGFSPSKALKMVNVTKKELDEWLALDVEFARLVKEVEWHKGNFFESSLVELVASGNPAAVIYANKTFNSDRGYGPATQRVEHSGSVVVGVLDMAELIPHLTAAARSEVLAAIRKREEINNRPPPTAGELISRQIAGEVILDGG